jgi:exopolysaccharide biosynthesis polyprenyl glycosylphosphotransferase
MRSFFKTPEKKEKYLLAAGDLVLLAVVLFCGFLIQLGIREKIASTLRPVLELETFPQIVAFVNLAALFLLFSAFFGFIYLMVFYVFGLYDTDLIFNRKTTLVKVGAGVLVGTLLLLGLLNILHKRIFFPEVWLVFGVLLSTILLLWRLVYSSRLATPKPYRVLFCGRDCLSDKAIANLSTNGSSKFFRVTGCTEADFVASCSNSNEKQNGKYDLIVYPFMKTLSQEHLIAMVKKKFEGVNVSSSLNFYKNVTGSFPVFELSAQWLVDLSMSLGLANQFQKRIKRFLDILFSGIGILTTLPIMLAIVAVIKLASDGPILFIHERLGLNRKPFLLYKFRTMVNNAESNTGPVWAQKGDPRVTTVGKILRKTRLDELPQFFNVLKGDMSFIGPRPIRQFFADKLTQEFPFYFLRFYVKPGLTGWAQVSGDYGETVEGQLRKLEYELFYIHEYSLLLDAVIILKTIQRVLSAKGQ